MKRRALRISTALFSVLAVGVLGTSLAWAHPVFPSRPHVDRPDLPGGDTTSTPGNTDPGNNTSPGNTSPGNTSPGNTSPGNSPGTTGTTTGNTATADGGQVVGGAISGTTDGGGTNGRALSGTTSGGHQRAGRGPANYGGSVGRGGAQDGTGLGGAASTPAVVRTRSGQAVFAGSVAQQVRSGGRMPTRSQSPWAGSHSSARSALSPGASYASPEGAGPDSRLVIGAALFAVGLVAMLGGLLVAEVRRRRAPAGAEGSLPPR